MTSSTTWRCSPTSSTSSLVSAPCQPCFLLADAGREKNPWTCNFVSQSSLPKAFGFHGFSHCACPLLPVLQKLSVQSSLLCQTSLSDNPLLFRKLRRPTSSLRQSSTLVCFGNRFFTVSTWLVMLWLTFFGLHCCKHSNPVSL